MRKELRAYFEEELSFLREMGKEFAAKHSTVASRFDHDANTGKWGDPHVDLMIDAFALLAARVRLKLDDDYPEVTESLINHLYPHYLAPIPSMTVVQFALDEGRGQTQGYRIPVGRELHSPLVDKTQEACQYRTSYPVELWPLEVAAAAVEFNGPKDSSGSGNYPKATLRISLQCKNGAKFSTLMMGTKNRDEARPIERLRFYLHGPEVFPFRLYDLIFNHLDDEGGAAVELRASPDPGATSGRVPTPDVCPLRLKVIGFEPEDGLLPPTRGTFHGYRLLTEYFAFPQKFLFFDVEGLDQLAGGKFGERCDLLIKLKNVKPVQVSPDNFRLGCTPAINLFRMDAAQLTLTHRQSEYCVIPDTRKEHTHEVYAIEEVALNTPRTRGRRHVPPLYSLRHTFDEEADSVFWHAVRRPLNAGRRTGTDVYLSLIDLNLEPWTLDTKPPHASYLDLKVTCFNRDLPQELPFGKPQGNFHLQQAAPVSAVECLVRPTPTRRLPLERGAQWRLISHLSLNHLSLALEGSSGKPEALRETLRLYDYVDDDFTRRLSHGIKSISRRHVAAQPGYSLTDLHTGEARRLGVVRGIETTIEFDEQYYQQTSLFLFASVLERFLGLSVSINSFSRMVAKTSEGEFKKWIPRMGEQVLL